MEPKFTYRELGALLIAVGTMMIERGLCAEATRDGVSDYAMRHILTMQYDLEPDRAGALLESVTNEQAIEYIDTSAFDD